MSEKANFPPRFSGGNANQLFGRTPKPETIKVETMARRKIAGLPA